MIETALRTIKKYNMLDKGCGVVIGFSGGADSSALFCLFLALRRELNLRLYAAHINHGLRGDEADRDEAFVREMCAQNGVELFSEKIDLRAIAKETSLGEEEAGRLYRYKFFEETAKRVNAQKIAVAHNLNDNAETVVMRLCRGAGLKGLCGIPPVRGNIIRPLIECPRESIEKFCAEKNINFVTDSTNLKDIYTRNAVRLNVLPMLEKINSRAAENIAKTSVLLSDDEDYMEQAAESAYQSCLEEGDGVRLNAEKLGKLHSAVLGRVIRKAVRATGAGVKDMGMYSAQSVKELITAETGKTVTLPNGVLAQTEYGAIVMRLKDEATAESFCATAKIGDTVSLAGGVKAALSTEELSEPAGLIYKRVFDLDKINAGAGGDFILRARRDGDVIKTFGGTKKLKKLFIDKKIPRNERKKAIVLCKGATILCVAPIETAKDYNADKNSTNRLYFYVWKEKP